MEKESDEFRIKTEGPASFSNLEEKKFVFVDIFSSGSNFGISEACDVVSS